MSELEPLRDELTRLPGRALLLEHLGLALARAEAEDREVALLHIGLDDFRLVNDSLGREAGDAAIREVASRLEELTAPRTIVARPGSDEFCVLLADLRHGGEDLAAMVAGQIVASLHDPFSIGGAQFDLSASVGLSVFPHDARNDSSLVEHAEAAMRDAKGIGAGTVATYSGGTQEAYDRLVLPLRLRTALERQQFVLQYQPIFSLADGSLVAAEALTRFRDPGRGLVAPLEFLPIAEYTGLIEPIGDWVIATACSRVRRWRDEGVGIPITVNVSLRQFRTPGFAARVSGHVAAHGIDPRDLIVEITESTAMLEPSCVDPVLQELRAANVRIAIDDFGTGHSSLARLKELPVDVVKLDRAFLLGAPADDGSRRLVSATIALVKALDMTTIAEGVETEEQLRFLQYERCSLAQGFHLARPLDEDEMLKLLRAMKSRGQSYPVAPGQL